MNFFNIATIFISSVCGAATSFTFSPTNNQVSGTGAPPLTMKKNEDNDNNIDSCNNNDNNGVKGKVILITGANRGIGKAFVESFLAHGASKIYAGVRDVEAAKIMFKDHLQNETTTKKKQNDDYASSCDDHDGYSTVAVAGIVIPIHIDMNDEETIKKASKDIILSAATGAITAVVNKSGDDGTNTNTDIIDIVINNAGVLTRTRTLDTNCIEQLQYEMNVNVYGLINIAKYFSPIMVKKKSKDSTTNGGGIFVQVNSVASIRCGNPRVSTYCASKAASFSITQSLKAELQDKYGIHVISIHPGPISTDMIDNGLFQDAPPPSIVSECLINVIKKSNTSPTCSSSSSSSSSDIVVPLPFMIFPDAMAEGLGKAYKSYAEIVHEQGKAWG